MEQIEDIKVKFLAENPELLNSISEQNLKHLVINNIRITLKKFKKDNPEFKDVKFSVVRDGYSCVRISWHDGPTQEIINNLLDKFEAGHFDGMIDCYEFKTGEARIFGDLFGNIQYLFCYRHLEKAQDET